MDDELYAFGNGDKMSPAAWDAYIEDATECRTCGGDALVCGHTNPYNVRAMSRPAFKRHMAERAS